MQNFYFILFYFILSFYFILFYFLAVLGLHCCTWAFSSCGEQGQLFIVVRGLLIAVASLVAGHGLQVHGLQYLQHTGSVVVGHRLSCSAIEPVSPASAGGFLTTAPQGSPQNFYFKIIPPVIFLSHPHLIDLCFYVNTSLFFPKYIAYILWNKYHFSGLS